MAVKSFLDGVDTSRIRRCDNPNHNGDEFGYYDSRGCGNPNCWKFKGEISLTSLQIALLAILDHAPDFSWSVQGFGMLRLYVRKVGRIHIWDSALRYGPNVSMVHTHSWDLTSVIGFGKLVNTRFVETTRAAHPDAEPWMKHRLLTGYQARPVTEPRGVWLAAMPPETLQAGDLYFQRAAEIHRTDATDGTVTLMKRKEDENGEADVYWPQGGTWGTATPRPATRGEVERTVAKALALIP